MPIHPGVRAGQRGAHHQGDVGCGEAVAGGREPVHAHAHLGLPGAHRVVHVRCSRDAPHHVLHPAGEVVQDVAAGAGHVDDEGLDALDGGARDDPRLRHGEEHPGQAPSPFAQLPGDLRLAPAALALVRSFTMISEVDAEVNPPMVAKESSTSGIFNNCASTIFTFASDWIKPAPAPRSMSTTSLPWSAVGMNSVSTTFRGTRAMLPASSRTTGTNHRGPVIEGPLEKPPVGSLDACFE